MKRIFKLTFILITSLFIFECKAQNDLPQDGDNILNNNINKFVGTWNWSENGKSLQIILKKENVKLRVGMNLRADVLIGFHKYIENGVEIENSTQYSNTNYIDNKSTIFGGAGKNETNTINGGIRHITKNKSIKFEIEYIDSTHIKLVELKDYPGLRVNVPGKPPYDWSISLPQNIILTKQ